MFKSRKSNRDSRMDFARDIMILEDNIKNGRFSFSPQTKKHASDLLKLRYAPNRRIDLDTVNEIVRSLSMSSNFK